ncbi:hypothetical protein KGM_215972 [Danaus plexippus plexippus]|uniref:RAP domain-containing protein n=1 Tax=Danaus plexippus plexippus TaxID=278856 RepID=A0A212ESI0_DANPL|nr:hypothetical protein KGM_215972 [Danaus plexippus plexippus]
MENNGYARKIDIDEDNLQYVPKEYFSNIMSKNFSTEDPHNIFNIFANLGVYCTENNLCISNEQFDNFIDNLTDNIKFASDDELRSLFFSLTKWPQTNSIRTRNFIEVWAALDDECFKRIHKWSYDEMLSFVSLFYMLNVIKYSDFCTKVLNKIATKCKNLKKSHVVQCLFFTGTIRRSPIDMHFLEVYVENHFTEFSTDELAVLAMGFFKSSTPIRSMTLISKIIDRIIENSKNIHEISLAALLKIIRYSIKIPIDNKLFDMLEHLQHECDRMSIMCNVQLALVGTSSLTLHENCLNQIAKRVIKSISETRIKDLERLVLTYGTFNHIPETEENFFGKVIEELRKPERNEEILKYGRSFSACVAFLGLLQIFPVDLIKRVLSREFLNNTYGGNFYSYGREILTIHDIAKLFIEDEVSVLTDKQVIALAKKYTDYVPCETYQKQYNITERMFLDIKRVLQEDRGGKDYVTGFHVIPHHQRGDLILCNNSEGAPVSVKDVFYGKQFGLLHKAPSPNHWIVLIVAGRNSMIQNSNRASGPFNIKIKELNTLGYYANIVKWNTYSNLKTDKEKIIYLNNLIEEALKSKL